jgi:hypothetical protein
LILDQAEKDSQNSEIDLKKIIENLLQKIKPMADEKYIDF